MRSSKAQRHVATAVGLLGVAPLYYAIQPESAGAWLAGLHGLVGALVLTRWFWVRWLVLGVAGGDLLLGIHLAMDAERLQRWGMLGLSIAGSFALLRLNFGEVVARSYDGQGAWAHRHRLLSSTVERIKRSFISIGLALPLLAELIGHHLPEARRPELAWSAVALIALGAFGLLRQRTWSLSAFTTAAALIAAFSLSGFGPSMLGLALAAPALLMLAVAPFAGPLYRALCRAET